MPRYAITTFGCQMNVHDSERLHEVLRGAGYVQAEEAEAADVIVLNTCSVREKAEQKLRSEVGRSPSSSGRAPSWWWSWRAAWPSKRGEAAPPHARDRRHRGAGQHPRAARFARGNQPRAAAARAHRLRPRRAAISCSREGARGPTAFVTIMKGCDERCSFCIVPHTRGPERYRASAEIVGEIRDLVAAGVREVTLLGQTVNSYSDPSRSLPPAPDADANDPDESEFAALLRTSPRRCPGSARLRYTSPHPRHVTPSLIAPTRARAAAAPRPPARAVGQRSRAKAHDPPLHAPRVRGPRGGAASGRARGSPCRRTSSWVSPARPTRTSTRRSR
jgi:tRNA-2-methylthio-N6-dimethylallyladenosine synthase